MNISAITFDIGGTLIEPWPSVGHVYAEVAARFGVNDIAPTELTKNFMRTWKSQTGFDYSRESWFVLVREAFGDVARHLPTEYFPAVYERFAEADTWRVYDDVFPTLQTLTRCGLPLGVISNWDERLRPLLARLGLDSYFSRLVISCEVGVAKPDPLAFKSTKWLFPPARTASTARNSTIPRICSPMEAGRKDSTASNSNARIPIRWRNGVRPSLKLVEKISR